MLARAAGAGDWSQAALTKEFIPTARLRLMSNAANTARCFGVPNGIGVPATVINKGPRIPNPRPIPSITLLALLIAGDVSFYCHATRPIGDHDRRFEGLEHPDSLGVQDSANLRKAYENVAVAYSGHGMHITPTAGVVTHDRRITNDRNTSRRGRSGPSPNCGRGSGLRRLSKPSPLNRLVRQAVKTARHVLLLVVRA